jgi:hypothetical protein
MLLCSISPDRPSSFGFDPWKRKLSRKDGAEARHRRLGDTYTRHVPIAKTSVKAASCRFAPKLVAAKKLDPAGSPLESENILDRLDVEMNVKVRLVEHSCLACARGSN